MRSFRNFALNNAVNFFQLVHQVSLVMQSSCSINKEDICLTRNRCLHSVKDNCRRISTFCMADNVAMRTLAPNLQLLACRSAEGIACCQNNLVFEQSEVICQLADSSSLAYTVNANNKNNRRLGTDTCTLAAVCQHFCHIFFQERYNILGTADFFLLRCFTHCVDQLFGSFYAYVRRQQNHFQLIEKIIVNRSRQAYKLLNAVSKIASCFRKAFL